MRLTYIYESMNSFITQSLLAIKLKAGKYSCENKGVRISLINEFFLQSSQSSLYFPSFYCHLITAHLASISALRFKFSGFQLLYFSPN